LDGLLQKLADAGFDYSDMRMQEQESDCNYDVPAASRFSVAQSSSAIDLITFEGANNWDALVDPVMGGKSVATATIVDQHGVLDGEVKIVPALQAPGFITAQSDVKIDASVAAGGELVMKVRSTTPDYTGFKVSFAASSVNPTLACATGGSSLLGRGCFKSPFTVPAGDDFTEIRIPLSEFSDKWDSATGELTTLCKDDASVCPSADKLNNVQRVAFWGEGKAGVVHIEVDSVAIEPAAQSMKATSAAKLVTFDGAEGTTFTFQELNDPVMGGKSTGTWSLGEGFGIFDGEVVDVPSLQAPGFIKAQASGTFPDVSAFVDGSLVLSVRTTNPEYEGYRVTVVSGATSPSFSCSAGGSLPFSRGCYKEKFSVPAGDDFVDVKIPFNTFSDKWSSATGEQTTTCADDSDVCLTANKLAKIQMIELWGEGAGGKVHLEVNSISAENADGARYVLV
jgi:hypothetical protein